MKGNMKTAQKSFDISAAMKELETINRWFQEEDVDVEKGIGQLKRAKELTEQVQARLKQVENDFVEIKEGFVASDAA